MKLFKLFFFVLLFFFVNSVYGQYKYEVPIWIKNNTGTALTNVQIGIEINTQVFIAAGWMQSDGKDIKFTTLCNGTSFLDHFVEGYINTDSTKIWVKVASIGANDSALVFMYFGYAGATNTSTLSVFEGPHSATDSVVVSTTNTVSNCQRGFAFTPTQDLLIGYFGKRIPNATQRYLTLFDVTTQAILNQIQVDAGVAGVYNYNLLTTPQWVKTGVQYIIALYNGAGDMYYYGVSTQMGQHMTWGGMRYRNTCTQNDYPTSTITNQHYGIPDFLYYTKQDISPEPTYRLLSAADTVTPAAPVGLTATPGNTQATLKWNKNTEFDITQYSVYKNTVNNPATSTLVGSVNHPDTTIIATGLVNGSSYYFWVKATDGYCIPKVSAYSTVASCIPVVINANQSVIPDRFYIEQNNPNPFNPTTTIKFGLKKDAFVDLRVYDIAGREVSNLINTNYKAGTYEINFDASSLSSGTYFYKIIAGEFEDIKKMVLIK